MLDNPEPREIVHLKDITFEAHHNDLIGVVGLVGSGKSSLLYAIMGEMDLIKGYRNTNGTIAYVEQDPFIIPGTIRDNIVLGLDYDEHRFNQALDASCLSTDIQRFQEGSETMVGEKGSTLSGGQKARISLARAVYADADIYLLDDPLSALDDEVSKKVYNK